jgi:hypothetical protein
VHCSALQRTAVQCSSMQCSAVQLSVHQWAVTLKLLSVNPSCAQCAVQCSCDNDLPPRQLPIHLRIDSTWSHPEPRDCDLTIPPQLVTMARTHPVTRPCITGAWPHPKAAHSTIGRPWCSVCLHSPRRSAVRNRGLYTTEGVECRNSNNFPFFS